MTTLAMVHDEPRRTELALAERHRHGDPAAFEEFYREYERMVFNLALRLTGDEHDAADCSQEAFVRIYRHLGAFTGRSALRTWVYKIVLNCFRTGFARRSRRRAVFRPLDEKRLARAVADVPGPEEVALATDLARRVREAVARVRPVYRETLVLRDVEGLSYQEIASVLGIRPGTVRSRIARGRDEVRKLMESEG